jgi:shikimate dehydrogenase
MPASGKTSLGKKLAKSFKLDFHDTDASIEKKEKMEIPEIFNMHGETYFRKIESAIISEISKTKNTVISTGGGIILDPKNVENLKKNSVIIFIDKNPKEILLYYDKTVKKRPLLENKNALYKLYKERYKKYESASDYTLRVSSNYFPLILSYMKDVARSFYPDSFYGVIGDPIIHSKSPELYSKLSLNSYEKYWVKEKFFNDFINAFKTSKLKGVNITAPFKEKMVYHLDEMTEDVHNIKSCNTVLKKKVNGKSILSGYNTDLKGLYLDLKEKNISYKNKTVAIIGDGGAGKGIIYYALKMGAKKVLVFVRNLDKVSKTNNDNLELYHFNDLKTYISRADLIIQATPLGMKGMDDYEDLSFFENIKKNAFIYDIIYAPKMTKFLKKAKAYGFKFSNGYGMLKKQAELSYEIFKSHIGT